MADPLLNTLCTICHINAPKYVCPGCSAQTCSLPCTKRHKSWANCSGRRDPAAFMPASRLKTPAGIDHDYNFLSAIERERARNQRDLVEDRKLFTERDVRAMEDDSRFRKHWLGDSVRFDPVRGGPRTFGEDGGDEDDFDNDDNEDHNGGGGGGGGDGPEGSFKVPAMASYLTRQVRQRLDSACIQVVQMPMGMSRQRENTTSWNRKSRSINWCVEWMVYDGGCEAAHTRIRHKALESVPLYKALGSSMAWYRKGQHKGEPDDEHEDKDEEEEPAYARKRRRVLIKEVREDEGRRTAMQDGTSATWATATPYPSQNPYTGTWGLDRGPSATSWLPDSEVEARRGYRFYLLKPLTPAGKPRELIPVAAAETLSSALQGRTVLEYPTFYVLPPPDSLSSSTPTPVLPEGYILGSTERRERPRRNNNNNNNNNNNKSAKRKATDNNNKKKNDKSQPPAKRQAMTAGGDDGGDGIPIRGPNNNQRGGRGGARGGRGGGRLQQQQQQARGGGGAKRPAQDAEEGEINSDGDEVPRKTAVGVAGRRRPDRAAAAADPADTSSSDPDTSSDEEEGEEEEVGEQGLTLKPSPRGGHDAMHIDDDDDDDDGDHDGPPEETRSTAAAAAGKRKSSGLGLVEYGSDSDGSDEDGDEDDEDVDLAGLKPENPELVASAIKEIVGLLT
jgi:hypothetical protein